MIKYKIKKTSQMSMTCGPFSILYVLSHNLYQYRIACKKIYKGLIRKYCTAVAMTFVLFKVHFSLQSLVRSRILEYLSQNMIAVTYVKFDR